MFLSKVLLKDLSNLRRIHNKIIDATNILVKSNSPHLNVLHLKVDNFSSEKEILEKLNR